MQVLRPHQQRLKEENPSRALLVHEMRTGKSLIAKNWSEHPDRNRHSIGVVLKQNKQEFQELCPDATIYTKEEFKKHIKDIIASKPSSVFVDEAHNFAAPLFIPRKRSQLAEALYTLIREVEGIHVLLLTATPLTNDPASLHTLLSYIGHHIPWKEYQQRFYVLEHKPFLPRPAYFPKPFWRGEANELLKKHADIVSLADCVDSLPPEISEEVKVKPGKYAYAEDEDLHWTKDHKAEQYNKPAEIKRLGGGHRKVIVVCHYTEQIDDLANKLKTQKEVFVLDGRTKEPEKVKQEAQASLDCFFIVQAKMGFGWDGYMFDAMVFASMAHRQIDYTQMLGRLTSVDNPKPKLYYYLLAGKWDKRIYKDLKAGEDFNPHKYE